MKTEAVVLRGVWGRWGFACAEGLLGPTAPCSMELWFGPASPSEGLRELSPPHTQDWLLCLKLPEENSCCTVLLLSWEMLTWNPLAVVVQLVRRSLLWLLADLGAGVGWAGGEQPLPSFLGSPGMDVGFQFPPLVWKFRAGLQREQVRTDYKVPVEFFKVFRFFLSFHPISWSYSVHSLVNNSGKPQAAKSDPCIFSDAEGI